MANSNPLMDPSLWGDDSANTPPAKSAPAGNANPLMDPSLWGEDAPKAKQGEATPAPVSTGEDVAKSGASGFGRGVEDLMGLPGDIDAGGRWIVAKALEKTGFINSADDMLAQHQQMKNSGALGPVTMQTSGDIRNKADAIGVPDYTPQTTAGKYARTAGEFVPGALAMPEADIAKIGANVIKYGVVPGLASEGAGQAFQGTKAEPYVRAAAGLAGGFGAEGLEQAGRAGVGAAQQYIEPFTQAGQQNWAARNFQGLVSDKDAALQTLNKADAARQPGQALGENVPGSKPTFGQLTGDTGALSAERDMATQDPAFFHNNPFGTGSDQQNAARSAALGAIQPTGSPESVSQAVRDRLDAIQTEHDRVVSSATAQAHQAAQGVGSGLPPEQVGENLRSALQGARDTAKAKERSLWNAVDPDGTLAMPAGPIADAANAVTKSLPKTAKPMDGEEAAIFNTAASLPPVAPFSDITALRSRISTAMKEELRSAGQTPTYARLSQLRGSVENAIDGAVENRVSTEAQAVSQGAMSPEQTAEYRLRDWQNQYYAARQDAATASGVGNGGSSAAGNSGTFGVSGTAGQTSGGFGSNARSSGLPGQALSPNLDEAAAARLKAASAATKDRANTFDKGPVGTVLKPDGLAGSYKTPDAAVPGKLFVPGPTGADVVNSAKKALGPNGMAPLHDAAAESLYRAAVKDGVVNPDEYAKWAAKHQDALRALPPDLQAKFANAASAGKALGDAAAARKAAVDGYQKSLLGKTFLGLTDPQDVTKRVGEILTAKDGVRRMSQLAKSADNDPAAKEGLRKAVADYILSRATGTTEAGASGANSLNASTFQKLIRDNASTIRAAGFSDSELANMRAIADDMQRGQRTMSATKLPNSPGTAQDLYKNIQAAHAAKPLTLAGLIGAHALGGFGIGGWHGMGWGVGMALGEHVIARARSAGIAKASTLVRDAMFNPELAKSLLMVAPRSPGIGSHVTLAHALGKMSLFGAEKHGDDKRLARASGGSVKKKLTHEELVARLMDLSEKAKVATKRDTRALLGVSDNTVAKALALAQKAI